MLTEIENNWAGRIEINGTVYDSISGLDFKQGDTIHIKLLPRVKKSLETQKTSVSIEDINNESEVKIFVKAYMTKKADPGFDFMAKWNDDNPMPMREMVGYKVKETRGMAYYKLHGMAQETITCMRCGRQLTNKVSRHYGIGPECITKMPWIANLSPEDVDGIREKLVDVKWEGWIIKSAILSEEEV